MREEYDFSGGVQGAHAARYAAGVEITVDGEVRGETVVSLAPDVAAIFPDSDAVNIALRILIKAAKDVNLSVMQKAS